MLSRFAVNATRRLSGLHWAPLSPPFDDYTDLLLSSVPEMEIGWFPVERTADAARSPLFAHRDPFREPTRNPVVGHA